jgi:hypothetical protein
MNGRVLFKMAGIAFADLSGVCSFKQCSWWKTGITVAI